MKPHDHPQILRSAAHNYEVRSFPVFFKPDVDAYAHDDILDLIVFYGLGFGIKAGDSLEERIAKFRRFLTGDDRVLGWNRHDFLTIPIVSSCDVDIKSC